MNIKNYIDQCQNQYFPYNDDRIIEDHMNSYEIMEWKMIEACMNSYEIMKGKIIKANINMKIIEANMRLIK